MNKLLLKVIALTMALLLLGACSGEKETEAALAEEKAALEVAINTLEKDELKSREAIGEVVDRIALLKAQLEEVHLSLDALKSQEILLMEDTGSAAADISEFPAVATDGYDEVIQGIKRYIETYTYQYDASNYPDDADIDELMTLAMKESGLYKFLDGGFVTDLADREGQAPLPWALIDAEGYDTSDALVNLLLEIYTPNDVSVFLDRYFTTDSAAINMPFYLLNGETYYNPNLIEGDRFFRQPADAPGVKWQRVTETELCLSFIYPVNVTDDQGQELRTATFEESYTFHKTASGWKLFPSDDQGPYIWSSNDDVWIEEAHTVSVDQVNQWVLDLDATLSDYPSQQVIDDTFYQKAHMVHHDSEVFPGADSGSDHFDVLVFNGDYGLMNLEVGEGIGNYLKADAPTDSLLYGLGPDTYVVQKDLADGGRRYDEYTYDYLTLDIESYIFNFIERKRAGVIALIGYDEEDMMRFADYYYMDEDSQIIRISYDQEGIYRVLNDVTVDKGYKE